MWKITQLVITALLIKKILTESSMSLASNQNKKLNLYPLGKMIIIKYTVILF